MDIFMGHMEDLADKAVKTGFAASKFLTPAEIVKVSSRFSKRAEITLSFDGGFRGAERMRALFTNPDWGAYERAKLFSALSIDCRADDKPGHRDILGALMALGVERSVIGDITPCALVCLPEISDYIIENLVKAGRAGISLKEITLDELPVKTEEMDFLTDTVASLRLDAVLCAAFSLSRSRASELIASGAVSLNHEPCMQAAKELSEGALLSIRGFGRARLLEVGGFSRKGRSFIKLGLYGR